MSNPRVDRDRVRRVVLETVAAEQFCSEKDLFDGSVHVVEAPARDPNATPFAAFPGGRHFQRPEPYFSLATLGLGGVVTASSELMLWVRPLYEGVDRDQMMEPARIAEVSDRMAEHGQKTFGPFPRWVCAEEDLRPQPTPAGYRIELRSETGGLPGADSLAGRSGYVDARRPGERTPRRLRAVASTEDGPIGSAGATADHDKLFQIGIAIAEEHRGRGLGRALTYAVTRAIFERGAVPYYGTTAVNVWSMRTAISCGFYPGWVHLFSRDVGGSRS